VIPQLVLLLVAASAHAGTVTGTLMERGTRTPIASAEVYLLPSQASQTTDEKGSYTFTDVASGEIEWVVNLVGYLPYRSKETLTEGFEQASKTIFLERVSYNQYETQIHDKAARRDDAVQVLTAKDFYSIPGANGDPIKAVRNLPGIHRTAISPNVIIEGSSPRDTRYLLEGHEVPLSIHFLGTSAVLMPEAVDRVEYYSAGYGPTYGRAMGGLIGVWARSPKADRMHGLGFVDIFNAGAMLEGPVGEKSSFMIGARRSYIDGILGLLLDEDELGFRVSPKYMDATLLYESEPTPIDRFRVLTVGSVDEVDLLDKESTSDSVNYSFHKSFFRLIPQLTHKHGSGMLSRWSIGLGREWDKWVVLSQSLYKVSHPVTVKLELENRVSDSWMSHFGTDYKYVFGNFNQADTFHGVPTEGAGFSYYSDNSRRFSEHLYGLYWLNTIHAPGSPWTFLPGVRLDHFTSTGEYLPAPRVAARYGLNEYSVLRAAGGLYYQPPEPSEVYIFGDRVSPRAWHASVGWDLDFREGTSSGFQLSSGGYYRYFDKLSEGGVSGIAKGRAYGWIERLQYENHPWKGAISYTLSRSTRWDPIQPEYLYEFDQTHNLNVLASVDLPRNWKISTRLRYVSGNLTTPFASSEFDDTNNSYAPIYGPLNSLRLGDFMQWDLRFDKRWIYDTWILSLYLDVQNVTNRKNVEFVVPAYDYTSGVEIVGLPIIPSLGVKAEF
jgi:hypothetical protein